MDVPQSVVAKEARRLEAEYCRENIDYFVETYGHFEDKDADELIQPFKLWKEQREALLSIHKHRLNIILKARQLGFSWMALHYAAYILILFTGKTVIALSRSELEVMELVRRLTVILRYMPEFVAEDKFVPKTWTGPVFKSTAMSITITYPDAPQGIFQAFTSSQNSGISFTANLIIFDEWAKQQYAEQIYTSAYPSINRPGGGKVIGLSTIERGSKFEEIFTDSDNGFNKIFIPWYADPRRDAEWYKQTKRAMGALITKEYPATIEEALEVPGGSYFPEVRVETHISKKELTGKLKKVACIDYGLDMLSVHWIQLDSKGNAQIYREYDESGLTVGQACATLLSLSSEENIELWLAPPDLWSRNKVDGRDGFNLWHENGINLIRTNNDRAAGCMCMKEWLRIPEVKEDEEIKQAKLTIFDGCAPNLYKCLQKIQKDKKRPNTYATQPHDITHDVDSLRCFCVYWKLPLTESIRTTGKKWTDDMLEDYKNADNEGKEYIIKTYGEPIWR